MNILVAGRLGRYAERILALREQGHTLVYCTMPAPRQKPQPDDLKDASVPQFVLEPGTAGRRVRELVAEYRIDVVYSIKNVWDGSLELLGELLDAGVGPVVRHYKEHFCEPSELERRSLLETAGQIYINDESFEYFHALYGVRRETAHILETDYLPAAYMSGDLRPKLSRCTGQPHLLVAGGVSMNGGRHDVRGLCEALAKRHVNVHIYGAKFIGPDSSGVWAVNHQEARREYETLTASGYIHLHPHVEPSRFVAEWSVYDAGLLHVNAEAVHDGFQRMNHPNRVAPYLAAGLPLAQQAGRQAAMERRIAQDGIGFLYRDYDELADRLYDRALMAELGERVREERLSYSFEHHVPELSAILTRYAG